MTMNEERYTSGLESEDWIKSRSWGLVGVETLADLLEALGVADAPRVEQRERLRHFATLSAWRPAPEGLKLEAAEFLSQGEGDRERAE
jgi:hypothetical protein